MVDTAIRGRPHSVPMTPRVIMTDFMSPPDGTPGGVELRANMRRLRDAGFQVDYPMQGVSALDVPPELITGVTVFVAGSPAGHRWRMSMSPGTYSIPAQWCDA